MHCEFCWEKFSEYEGTSHNRRWKEHQKTEKEGWPMWIVATGLTRLEARMLEQLLICSFTFDSLANARYEIAKGNYGKAANELTQVATLTKLGDLATLLEMQDILNHD